MKFDDIVKKAYKQMLVKEELSDKSDFDRDRFDQIISEMIPLVEEILMMLPADGMEDELEYFNEFMDKFV